MELAWAYSTYLPLIEAEMHGLVRCTNEHLAGHYGMMQYHLGWVDASFSDKCRMSNDE